MDIDDKDRKIIDFFARKPRSSFSKASEELKWSKTTIKNRHDKLSDKTLVKTFLCLNASSSDFNHALSFVEITNPETEVAILTGFDRCPLITTLFSLSGFEYSLVICLVSEKQEDIAKFMDVFPLSQLDGVKRKNSYFAKKTERFADKPFWVPISPDSGKINCGLKCDYCPIIKEIKNKFSSPEDLY